MLKNTLRNLARSVFDITQKLVMQSAVGCDELVVFQVPFFAFKICYFPASFLDSNESGRNIPWISPEDYEALAFSRGYHHQVVYCRAEIPEVNRLVYEFPEILYFFLPVCQG